MLHRRRLFLFICRFVFFLFMENKEEKQAMNEIKSLCVTYRAVPRVLNIALRSAFRAFSCTVSRAQKLLPVRQRECVCVRGRARMCVRVCVCVCTTEECGLLFALGVNRVLGRIDGIAL